MQEHERKIKFRKMNGTGKNAPQFDDKLSNAAIAKSDFAKLHL
jgi:hypothetical protein